ncbi:transposase [Candidatus Nomurabacteria bacterium]|nr:transposase [Candidatus Nomurabacteria bacterium]
MNIRKRYTSEEKTKILRDYLENNVPISDLADKYGLHPNIIYRWKKQMFETAPENLDNLSKNKKKSDKQLIDSERRITELEALLAKRESLIAELVEDNIRLKKKTDGATLIKLGLNRK